MSIILAVTAAEVFKYIGYILVAILCLMIMIIIHELGHYTAGRLLGFKIDEFGIGFGPAIIRKTNKKTGTVFTLRPFPIGGFCAFHGEDEEGEDPQAFNNQKPWKRLIVLFSGAFMNFVSAIIIITIYFSCYGQILPVIVGTHETTSSLSGSLQEGDYILNVNGKQVNLLLEEDLNNVFAKAGDSCTFYVLRDGKRVKVDAGKGYYVPYVVHDFIYSIDGEVLETPVEASQMNTIIDKDGPVSVVLVQFNSEGQIISQSGCSVQRGVLDSDPTGYYSYGYGITRSVAYCKLPFFLALGRSFGFCFYVVFKILASLGALITGKLGAESVGGTVTTIATMAKVSSLGFGNLLYVVAIISANLAVMNLLPFPALDGSRMLFTLIEMIFRKPVPRKIEAIIHTVGLVLLIILAVFLDIFHLVSV